MCARVGVHRGRLLSCSAPLAPGQASALALGFRSLGTGRWFRAERPWDGRSSEPATSAGLRRECRVLEVRRIGASWERASVSACGGRSGRTSGRSGDPWVEVIWFGRPGRRFCPGWSGSAWRCGPGWLARGGRLGEVGSRRSGPVVRGRSREVDPGDPARSDEAGPAVVLCRLASHGEGPSQEPGGCAWRGLLAVAEARPPPRSEIFRD